MQSKLSIRIKVSLAGSIDRHPLHLPLAARTIQAVERYSAIPRCEFCNGKMELPVLRRELSPLRLHLSFVIFYHVARSLFLLTLIVYICIYSHI